MAKGPDEREWEEAEGRDVDTKKEEVEGKRLLEEEGGKRGRTEGWREDEKEGGGKKKVIKNKETTPMVNDGTGDGRGSSIVDSRGLL
ncbi:hypothetical protein TSMEX_001813 [Taenia solium]|eukprot:TsM_001163700 transcript=TsM_001163700 gene=TsM_001163700